MVIGLTHAMFSPLVQWQEFTSLIVCAVGGLFASASVGIFRIHYPFITLYTTSFKLILGMVVLWALPHDVLLAEHDGPMILMGFLGFQTGVLMEGFGYGGVKSLRSSQSKPSSIGFRNCHNNIASKRTRSAGPTFLGDSFEALQTIHLKPDRYLRSANPPAKVGY